MSEEAEELIVRRQVGQCEEAEEVRMRREKIRMRRQKRSQLGGRRGRSEEVEEV
jgi:hypothetical protein